MEMDQGHLCGGVIVPMLYFVCDIVQAWVVVCECDGVMVPML